MPSVSTASTKYDPMSGSKASRAAMRLLTTYPRRDWLTALEMTLVEVIPAFDRYPLVRLKAPRHRFRNAPMDI
jgi:hypothetical protein